jgi:hypothetical protein
MTKKATTVKKKEVAIPKNDVGETIKGGRPTEYTQDNAERICTILRGLVMLNKSETEIAEALRIKPTTLATWKAKFTEVFEALQPQSIVDGLLLGSGFKAAIGHYYFEEVCDKDGNIHNVRKYAKPDSRIWQILASNRLKITDKLPEDENKNKTFNLILNKEDLKL